MKTFHSVVVLPLLLIFTTLPAHADAGLMADTCGDRPATPAPLAGERASDTDMRRYGADIRAYTAQLMAYLSCLDDRPASPQQRASAEYRQAVIADRRQVVADLAATMAAFNQARERFQERGMQVAARP